MSARTAPILEPSQNVDRRRHQRVKVSLLGRCMFADQREVPCQVVDISPGGATMLSPQAGAAGERVIAYVDHIGRIEGQIVRRFEGGFAMTIAASARKRDRLADTLTWLANRHVLNLTEDRQALRRAPKRSESVLTLSDGASHPCRVIDMSLTGAALLTPLRPPVGAHLHLGRLGARVVRHFEDGIAIQFLQTMSEGAIERTIEREFF